MRFVSGSSSATFIDDQFVRTRCDNWYHLGCVGVGPNDPSMDDAELYTCPPCATGVLLYVVDSYPCKSSILIIFFYFSAVFYLRQ
jgi:hypothetical protein